MHVVSDVGVDGADRDQLLMLAAALGDASDQPIAAAIAQAGRDWFGALPQVRDVSSVTGGGVARSVLSYLVREEHVLGLRLRRIRGSVGTRRLHDHGPRRWRIPG